MDTITVPSTDSVVVYLSTDSGTPNTAKFYIKLTFSESF